jgi:anthranilate synthase component 1
MHKQKLYTRSLRLLADTITPVSVYLKLRDVYANSVLLESSDYHGHENSLSLICCQPLAGFEVKNDTITTWWTGTAPLRHSIAESAHVPASLAQFLSSFEASGEHSDSPARGLFGFTSYTAARYFDRLPIGAAPEPLPDMLYHLYRFVLVIDHFFNQLTIYENVMDEQEPSQLEQIRQIIVSNRFSSYPFLRTGPEQPIGTEPDFIAMVKEGIRHCERGNVFQIVLSRGFRQTFRGDEFAVYRALRSVNPSPYLFFFDYGDFKLFGSSPEAQLQVSDGQAAIFPIAGTFRRTGNDQEDARQAEQLARDAKENAEHIMLVDLARNDLSRACDQVTVEVFKEIQYYSHVIHLVSKVTGRMRPGVSAVQLLADTFPAGTLSGAPKHMAMNLIHQLEKTSRGFYGGAIGFIGLNGSVNQAILIRSFLSTGNQLTYQAGAGVVAQSVPEKELQEVNNKLGALRHALALAEQL